MSEGNDTFVCLICSKRLRAVTGSHLRSHGMTTREYKRMFPDARLSDCSWFDVWRNCDENKAQARAALVTARADEAIEASRRAAVEAVRHETWYRERLSEGSKRRARSPEGLKRLQNKPVTSRMKLSNYERWSIDFGKEAADERLVEWMQKNVIPSRSRWTKPELFVMSVLLTDVRVLAVGQARLGGRCVDLFIPSTNQVIEVNGSYWHADPRKFKGSDVIGAKRTLADQIWRADEQKRSELTSAGFEVLSIWSDDIKNSPFDVIATLKEFVSSREKSNGRSKIFDRDKREEIHRLSLVVGQQSIMCEMHDSLWDAFCALWENEEEEE